MYGAEWTAERVIERLVEAFRCLPMTPVWSPAADQLQPAFFERPIDGADLIVATGHYLGFRSAHRRRLLAYARAKGDGQKVAHLCLAEGWARASLYRHVTRAAETVAEGLNQDRRPPRQVA